MKKLYFAYGSNMLQERLEARVGKVEVVRAHTLWGWRLVFNAGQMDRCFANIVMTGDRDYVQGIVFSLLPKQLQQLDLCEGHPNMYTRMVVGRYINKDIFAYVAINPRYTQQEVRKVMPAEDYVQIMLQGANNNNLKELALYLSNTILPNATKTTTKNRMFI